MACVIYLVPVKAPIILSSSEFCLCVLCPNTNTTSTCLQRFGVVESVVKCSISQEMQEYFLSIIKRCFTFNRGF